MQMCLYLGMSLCCKHPFVMEYVWNTLIIKVLPQTAEDMLSFPILFSYFLTSDLTLSSFRRIILISSWKTYKIILICSVKLIFAHKIPHKPLICKTPGVLTKLPKVIKKTPNQHRIKRHLCHQRSFVFPIQVTPTFLKITLVLKWWKSDNSNVWSWAGISWGCLQQNSPSAQSIRLQRYKISFSKVGFLFENRTHMISKTGAVNSASRMPTMSANKLPLYIPSTESSEAAAFQLILCFTNWI